MVDQQLLVRLDGNDLPERSWAIESEDTWGTMGADVQVAMDAGLG